MICRQNRPLWTPVSATAVVVPDADDNRVAEDICHGGQVGTRVRRSGEAQCKQRTRLCSSSVDSRSAQSGRCRAVDTVVSWNRKAIPCTGGPYCGFAKRESAVRASANQKCCSFRSSEAPAGAINKVHSRRQMRLHRGDAWRKTVAESTILCGGARAGAAAATKSLSRELASRK